MKKHFFIFSTTLVAICLLASCTSNDLFEKSVVIPGHAWKSSFKPSFAFTIKDTTTPYQAYFVIRHNERYSFNNIYINMHIKGPGQDTAISIQQDIPLADKEKWLGEAMDDIYEHRVPLGKPQTLKAGKYTFTIEQIMREDPLNNVLNTGLRIERQ